MSGARFYKEENRRWLPGRRSFLIRSAVLMSAIFLDGCIRKFKSGSHTIPGKLIGPDHRSGHILRDKVTLPPPSGTRKVKTLIIGGGISGLSAARWLKLHGHEDFELLELEHKPGGNSRSGQNKTSAYPLGAHYITIANAEDRHLAAFLEECGVIRGYENGLPVYNEYYLCFDPEERLLINGQWQEGLVPEFGISDTDRRQFKKFFRLMEHFRQARGNDGRYAFDIPVDSSSKDERYRRLDRITFTEYLNDEGFHAKPLLWYLDYCCKDDYGQQAGKISAWAGIHYFAARRGKAANADTNAVLTWPEGNGWLSGQLAEGLKTHIKQRQLCYGISPEVDGGVSAWVYHAESGSTELIHAERVILASPQFVNQRLLTGFPDRKLDIRKMNYAPWFVANVTVSGLPQRSQGPDLCWDNVAYGSDAVGYVNAGHQLLKRDDGRTVLSWYLPLCKEQPRVARLTAYTRSYEQWLDILLPDLEFMHPGITPFIEEVECWVWGHGMISPVPGYIWGDDRFLASQPLNGNIFFAHTDLGGISIFEEAFHQGIRAAGEVLRSYGKED